MSALTLKAAARLGDIRIPARIAIIGALAIAMASFAVFFLQIAL